MSPIKSLTTAENRGDQFGVGPLLAVFRKGAPQTEEVSKKGKKYMKVGSDLNHFRADFGSNHAHLQQAFEEMYGRQPTTIKGAHVTGDSSIEMAFDTWMLDFKSSRLERKCNGDQIILSYNDRTHQYSDTPRPCEKGQCKCRQSGRLYIWLPEFTLTVGVMGHFVVETHSIDDIKNIYKALFDAHNALAGSNASINSVSWTLSRVIESKSTRTEDRDGNPGRARKDVAIIHLDADTSLMQALLEKQNREQLALSTGQHALPAPNDALALPAPPPGFVDQSTGEIIDADDDYESGSAADPGGNNPDYPPADDGTVWSAELLLALGSLLLVDANAIRAALNAKVAISEVDIGGADYEVFVQFEHTRITDWLEHLGLDRKDSISHLLLDPERSLKPYQVRYSVLDLADEMDNRTDAPKKWVADLLKVFTTIVGYDNVSKARAGLNIVTDFLFERMATEMDKGQVKALNSWLQYERNDGSVTYPSAMTEIGEIIECWTLFDAMLENEESQADAE